MATPYEALSYEEALARQETTNALTRAREVARFAAALVLVALVALAGGIAIWFLLLCAAITSPLIPLVVFAAAARRRRRHVEALRALALAR